MPVLVCPKNVDRRVATDTLMSALKAWRSEIIEILESEATNKVARNP